MLFRSRIFTVLILLVAAASNSAFANDDAALAEKKQLAAKFLQVTEGEQLGMQMAEAVIGQFRSFYTRGDRQLPDAVWGEIVDEIRSVFQDAMPELMDSTAQIYADHFTQTELQEILVFYQTDTGRKTLEMLPQIMDESIRQSQSWAQKLVPTVQQRVADRLDQMEATP